MTDGMKIDLDALVQEVKDYAFIKAASSMAPDKGTAEQIEKMLLLFVKHGVPANTAFDILKELITVLGNDKGE